MAGAFSSAFSLAFSAGGRVAQYLQPSMTVNVRVVDDAVYDSFDHGLSWSASVVVNGVDISSRLVDRMSIQAAEESARVAAFSMVVASSVELAGLESAPVTVDLTVFSITGAATYRRFTGVVETVDFAPESRIATLHCRDGYQERIKACSSSAAVESMFSGLHTACLPLLKWDDAKPDAPAYFSGLLATVPGSVFIDGAGLWRAFSWDIGPAETTFSPADIFDDTLRLSGADRSGLPAAIEATLTLRVARLHNVDLAVSWEGVSYNLVGLGLGSWTSKTSILNALAGLDGWLVKGAPAMTSPLGSYVVQNGSGGQFPMIIQSPELMCLAFSATLYHRWYQEVDYVFTSTIDVGGSSDRDTSIAHTMATDFDAAGWETVPSRSVDVSVYAANPPTGNTPTQTGYEALPGPWPPLNGALDYCPDISTDDIQAAARFVVSKAIRLAAQGRRQRRVEFARPLDPRLDISAVLAVNYPMMQAHGQLAEFTDDLDFDGGSAVTSLTLTCPVGDSTVTSVGTVAIDAPSAADVAHSPAAPILGNWTGSANTMTVELDDSKIQGLLWNLAPTAAQYDATKPMYTQQFRIVMPAIPVALRDPTTINQTITAAFSLAGGSLTNIF